MSKYGGNLKWFMSECSVFLTDNAEENECEIIGEDDDGVEGTCTIIISETIDEGVSRIEALEAALTEAHRVILHELDSGRTPYMLKAENGGKGLGYFEDVLSGVIRHT